MVELIVKWHSFILNLTFLLQIHLGKWAFCDNFTLKIIIYYIMSKLKTINELVKNVINALPNSVKEGEADIEKNIKSVFLSAFNRLDLVTREEFDIQSQVLNKTRQRLEQLEKRIARYEENPD